MLCNNSLILSTTTICPVNLILYIKWIKICRAPQKFSHHDFIRLITQTELIYLHIQCVCTLCIFACDVSYYVHNLEKEPLSASSQLMPFYSPSDSTVFFFYFNGCSEKKIWTDYLFCFVYKIYGINLRKKNLECHGC